MALSVIALLQSACSQCWYNLSRLKREMDVPDPLLRNGGYFAFRMYSLADSTVSSTIGDSSKRTAASVISGNTNCRTYCQTTASHIFHWILSRGGPEASHRHIARYLYRIRFRIVCRYPGSYKGSAHIIEVVVRSRIHPHPDIQLRPAISRLRKQRWSASGFEWRTSQLRWQRRRRIKINSRIMLAGADKHSAHQISGTGLPSSYRSRFRHRTCSRSGRLVSAFSLAGLLNWIKAGGIVDGRLHSRSRATRPEVWSWQTNKLITSTWTICTADPGNRILMYYQNVSRFHPQANPSYWTVSGYNVSGPVVFLLAAILRDF